MKRLLGLLVVITMFVCGGIAFAGGPITVAITVINKTDKTVTVMSSISPELVGKIKINGSTDTPRFVLAPNDRQVFLIENIAFYGPKPSEKALLIFTLKTRPDEDSAYAQFPLAGGDYGIRLATSNYDCISHSNDDYVVGAVYLKEKYSQDATVQIDPVVF